MAKRAAVDWEPWAAGAAPKVKREAHAFTRRAAGYHYCARCGLVALRNEATRRAMRALCETLG